MFKRGFTLIEISVSMGIISLVMTGGILLVFAGLDSARYAETILKLTMLKQAVIGDPQLVTGESRTDFGYVGDMGSLPTALEDLWVKGSQPAFFFIDASQTGAGWAGPYVETGMLTDAGSLAFDGWGNPIQYVRQAGTSAVSGQEYRARIFSYGPDTSAGGGDDLTAEIYTTELLSTVFGYVRDSSGNPLPSVAVNLNYPVAGVLTTSTATSSANGAYSFSEIPFGNRSVTIEPQLVYAEDTAVTFGNGSDVEFAVVSFTCGTITSVIPALGTTAYFEQFRIGNTTVFNSNSNRAGSGELVTFSAPFDISWSGCGIGGTGLYEIFPVRIQSAFTQIPDRDLGAGGSSGKTFRIRVDDFRTQESGGSQAVDMTGQSIGFTFSNGAVTSFSPIPN
jgi:prepilin-type N-terminal cleavage/methylation domain-containing protein